MGGRGPRARRVGRQFSNVSADILEPCCWALDLVDIPWRRNRAEHVSVSRRESVARLDELIGPKT